jgi:flavin-dependent dehydrogenase
MHSFDIVIAGFGPAGTVAAIHLHRMGYKVAVAGELRRFGPFEGLAPRTLEGLRRAGLEQAVAAASVEAARTASWNGATNAANREYLIDRQIFDRALVEDCRAAGIPVFQGRVGTIGRTGEEWHLRLNTSTTSEILRGRFFIEARGRRAPHQGVTPTRGPRALAISRRYACTSNLEAQTCLKSYQEGWSWFARTRDGQAVVQLVISGNRPELKGKTTLTALFTTEILKLPHLKCLLGPDTRPQGPVMARESSAIISGRLASPDALRVGDAAFAIDPLSGHGNFEAVGGAMAAATVINTLLAKAESSALALDFYKERATSAFMRHARVGRDFYRMEQSWPDAPFWQERRFWPDDLPAHAAATSAPPRLSLAPVIENDFIVERQVFITADQPRGIRMVDGVPVPELFEALQSGGPDATPQALGRRFNATPAQLTTAIEWLKFRGFLRPRSG